MLRLTPQERSVLHVEWYGCGSKKSCNSEVLESVNKEIQQKKIHLMASNLPYDLTEIIAESEIHSAPVSFFVKSIQYNDM